MDATTDVRPAGRPTTHPHPRRTPSRPATRRPLSPRVWSASRPGPLDFALGRRRARRVAGARVARQSPVGLVAVAGLVALALTRRPTRSPAPAWAGSRAWPPCSSPTSSSSRSADRTCRCSGGPSAPLRLALVLTALLFLVTGRIHYPSLVRGMAVGLLGNAVLFFAGVAPAPYGTLLSGFLLDKNQAGLAYTVIGILLLGLTTDPAPGQVAIVSRRARWSGRPARAPPSPPWPAPWSGSRCGPRLGVAARARPGRRHRRRHPVRPGELRPGWAAFADRVGTDWFRARIDAASRLKLDAGAVARAGPGRGVDPLRRRRDLLLPQLLLGGARRGGLGLPGWRARRDRLVRHAPAAPGATALAGSPSAARRPTSPCSSAPCASARCSAPRPRSIALAAGLIGYLQAESLRRPAPRVATVAR